MTKEQQEREDLATVSQYIAQCLEDAKEYGLEAEVVTWALYHMRKNPKLHVSQAMEAGMQEWDV